MKILHLLPGLKVGGQETMIVNIANEQVKTEDVIVMIINDDYDEHLLSLFDKKVDIVLLGRPRSSRNPLWLLKLNYKIWRLHPYVVHSHYEKIISYLIRTGYKFVYTIHDTTIPSTDLERNINTCAISKCVQEDVIRRTSLKPIVIYNGIKVESIKQARCVNPYSNKKPFKIVQVSRLAHEKKGQHILINAISILANKGYTNLQLDFIGDGNSREYLEEYTKELSLYNVSFLGTMPVKFLQEHLCEYNLFVQPSLFEGFGLTVAEAMAAKVPVLVSNIEGPLEIIEHGEFGWTFVKGSAADCADKIEQIIKCNKETLQKRIDDAWNHVYNCFSVKMTAKNYIVFYKNVK